VVIGADVAEVRGVFAERQSSTAVAVAVVCQLWEDDVQAVNSGVLWRVVVGLSSGNFPRNALTLSAAER
jgi:hypothetical protein